MMNKNNMSDSHVDIDSLSWFINDRELRGRDAFDYLTGYMADMHKLILEVRDLSDNIHSILDSMELTGDPVYDATELGEVLSLTEIHCELFLESYRLLSRHEMTCQKTGRYRPLHVLKKAFRSPLWF